VGWRRLARELCRNAVLRYSPDYALGFVIIPFMPHFISGLGHVLLMVINRSYEEIVYISNSTFFAHWEIDLSDKTGSRPYEKLAMPLYKNDKGVYTNYLCAESYTQAFVEDQIARGLEFGSKSQHCFLKIKMAYDAIFLTGEFQLDDEENCAKLIPEYDRRFGKGN